MHDCPNRGHIVHIARRPVLPATRPPLQWPSCPRPCSPSAAQWTTAACARRCVECPDRSRPPEAFFLESRPRLAPPAWAPVSRRHSRRHMSATDRPTRAAARGGDHQRRAGRGAAHRPRPGRAAAARGAGRPVRDRGAARRPAHARRRVVPQRRASADRPPGPPRGRRAAPLRAGRRPGVRDGRPRRASPSAPTSSATSRPPSPWWPPSSTPPSACASAARPT